MDYLDDFLYHIGMPRRSGRYPYGSGDNPYQHAGDFLSRIDELKKQGLSQKEIADYFKLTTTQLRIQTSLASNERRMLKVDEVKGLAEKGYTPTEIARELGYKNESSVRSLLNVDSEARMNQAMSTADFLKEQVKEKGMIDVGLGVEKSLNVSYEKLKEALYILQLEGYEVHGGRVPQITNPNGRKTTLSVLCPPGTPHSEIFNYENIHYIDEYTSHDDGEHFDKFVYPSSMDSKRLQIRYAEDGGIQKDGLIELRRNVDDISLGNSTYAQVRILVDGKSYLKGMAVYADDLPPGVDVRFNSNKKRGTPLHDGVLKKISDDPENPFGSLIKAGGQSYYIDKDGNRKLSLINKRAEEGDWGEWADKLPSQFLSKQNKSLIKHQLGLSIADAEAEFEEIKSLTNPTVKKALLQSFSDDCDSAAVHLKAAALPRQKYQVILPFPEVKDTEVYAPQFHPGEKVALVRFPHGGPFEIPVLTVNNKIASCKKTLGTTPKDAIGINSHVAERLSGADFDGDTVMVIPIPKNKNLKITSSPPLKGLEGFDPKMAYPAREGMKIMTKANTQKEMGIISNLITDMTLKGATPDELARAVRHSMVVIDAAKHKLDYKKSEDDNHIKELHQKYQGHIGEDGKYHEGSATLISRASSPMYVNKRVGSPRIDPKTGEVYYHEVVEKYIDKKTGKEKIRTNTSTVMAETKDARTLSSGTVAEELYATYANKMKALGNEARKEMLRTGRIEYHSSAKKTYEKEVEYLDTQLKVAIANKPRERQAQILANSKVKAMVQDNPSLALKENKDQLKKIKQRALTDAREKVGAHRETIKVTDKAWEAIQAGAISENKLKQIIDNIDIDELRERATPRVRNEVSSAKANRIAAMSASGYTTSEIAKQLNLSASTVSKYI